MLGRGSTIPTKNTKTMSPHWTKAKHKTLYTVILEARKTNLKVERDHPGKDWATIWKRTLYKADQQTAYAKLQ